VLCSKIIAFDFEIDTPPINSKHFATHRDFNREKACSMHIQQSLYRIKIIGHYLSSVCGCSFCPIFNVPKTGKSRPPPIPRAQL